MTSFSVTCPHCRALIEIDGERQVVVGSKPHEEPKTAPSLEGRLQALSDERAAARAKMDEAMRVEKAGASIREEKFKKLLDVAKSEPVVKPVRDVDLD
jgi:hypothetical protein